MYSIAIPTTAVMRNFVLVLVVVVAPPAAAQTDSSSKPTPHLCWRGKPAPECSTFWITEFGFDAVFLSSQQSVVANAGPGYTSTYTLRDFGSRVAWTIGPMFNTGPFRAVGGTVSFSPFSQGYRAALEGRKRSWTSEGSSLDLTAGLLRMDMPRVNARSETDYGVTGSVMVVGGDLINLNTRADLLFVGSRPRFGASIGIGVGSYAAVATTVGLAVLIAIAISQFHGD
jgi:hypothetical protein